jgi:hypothetical protein
LARNNVTTFVFRGEIHWAKIFGPPRPNYNKDGKEWTFDFIPDDAKEAKADLKSAGVADRLKTREDRFEGRSYLSFKQKEFRADGKTPNEPIRVVDASGADWDPSVELGNGTKVDVKFVVIDNGPGKFAGIYPRSIRVLALKEFKRQDFEPISEEDEFYEAAKEAEERRKREYEQFKKDFGVESEDNLDDDLPFEA